MASQSAVGYATHPQPLKPDQYHGPSLTYQGWSLCIQNNYSPSSIASLVTLLYCLAVSVELGDLSWLYEMFNVHLVVYKLDLVGCRAAKHGGLELGFDRSFSFCSESSLRSVIRLRG